MKSKTINKLKVIIRFVKENPFAFSLVLVWAILALFWLYVLSNNII